MFQRVLPLLESEKHHVASPEPERRALLCLAFQLPTTGLPKLLCRCPLFRHPCKSRSDKSEEARLDPTEPQGRPLSYLPGSMQVPAVYLLEN